MACTAQTKADVEEQTKADVAAESAFVKGKAKSLSRYFQQPGQPSRDVVQAIACGLLATADVPGPGNWKLVFSTRKGGRPLKASPSPTGILQALATGQAIPAGVYLLADPKIDDATKRLLADAFDPAGKSKWQLKFTQARKEIRAPV